MGVRDLLYGDILSLVKTTIDLPDALIQRVKELAHTEGVSMRELMIAGLTSEVERRSTPAKPVEFVFPTTGGSGLSDDVDPSALTQLAYDLPR